jgi:hypothetical protein
MVGGCVALGIVALVALAAPVADAAWEGIPVCVEEAGCVHKTTVCALIMDLGQAPSSVLQYVKPIAEDGSLAVAEYSGSGTNWLVQGLCAHLAVDATLDCTSAAILDGGNPLDCVFDPPPGPGPSAKAGLDVGAVAAV